MALRSDLGWEEQWPGVRGQKGLLERLPSNICNICTSAQRQGSWAKLPWCQAGGIGPQCDCPRVGAPGVQSWLHPKGLCVTLGQPLPLHLSHLHKEGFGLRQ